MCLKAPKIRKHTERLELAGWDFISKFANKNKEETAKKKMTNLSQDLHPHYKIHE